MSGVAQATDVVRRRRLSSTDVFCVILLLAVVARFALGEALSTPSVAAWTTVFAAICIQAAPFLTLGIGLSTIFAVFRWPGSRVASCPVASAPRYRSPRH